MSENKTENKIEKKVDDYFIKLSPAPVVITGEQQIDDDVTVAVQGTITKVEDTTNNDGTVNRTYVVKGVFASVVTRTIESDPQIIFDESDDVDKLLDEL